MSKNVCSQSYLQRPLRFIYWEMNTAPVVGCRCFLPLFCHFFPTERSGPSAASDEGDDDDYVDGQNGYVGGHGDSVGCHDDSVGGYDDVNVV